MFVFTDQLIITTQVVSILSRQEAAGSDHIDQASIVTTPLPLRVIMGALVLTTYTVLYT